MASLIQGTVQKVYPNNFDNLWKALIIVKNSEFPVLVESEFPIDVEVGNDITINGEQKQTNNVLLESTVYIKNNIENRISSFLNSKEINVISSFNQIQDTLTSILNITPNVKTVKWSQDVSEPDIKWAMDLYSQLSTNHIGPIIFLHPSNIFDKSSKYISKNTPLLINKDNINSISNYASPTSFTSYYSFSPDAITKQSKSIIMPYNPYQTSIISWMSLSHSLDLLPKQIATPESIRKFTIAHELTHSYTINQLNHFPQNLMQSEGFADSMAIMVYILKNDNMDQAIKDMKFHMSARAVGFLEGDRYQTGLVSAKAIESAIKLKQEYKNNDIPMDIIALEAKDLINKYTMKNSKNHNAILQYIDMQNINWLETPKSKNIEKLYKIAKDFSSKTYKDYLNTSVDKEDLFDINIAKEQVKLVASLMDDYIFTIHDLNNPENEKVFLNNLNVDLEETLKDLKKNKLERGVKNFIRNEIHEFKKFNTRFINFNNRKKQMLENSFLFNQRKKWQYIAQHNPNFFNKNMFKITSSLYNGLTYINNKKQEIFQKEKKPILNIYKKYKKIIHNKTSLINQITKDAYNNKNMFTIFNKKEEIIIDNPINAFKQWGTLINSCYNKIQNIREKEKNNQPISLEDRNEVNILNKKIQEIAYDILIDNKKIDLITTALDSNVYYFKQLKNSLNKNFMDTIDSSFIKINKSIESPTFIEICQHNLFKSDPNIKFAQKLIIDGQYDSLDNYKLNDFSQVEFKNITFNNKDFPIKKIIKNATFENCDFSKITNSFLFKPNLENCNFIDCKGLEIFESDLNFDNELTNNNNHDNINKNEELSNENRLEPSI